MAGLTFRCKACVFCHSCTRVFGESAFLYPWRLGFQVQGKSEPKTPDRWCGRKKLAEERWRVCAFQGCRPVPSSTPSEPPGARCAPPRREAWPLSSNLKESYFSFLAVLGFCCFAQAVSSCGEQRASHCRGFSCCEAQSLSVRAQQLQNVGPGVVAHGLINCSAQA